MPSLTIDEQARIFNLPIVNLYEKNPSHDGLSLIPETIAFKKRVIVFEIKPDFLKVAIENPQDKDVLGLLEGIKKTTEKPIELFLASRDHITYALEWYKDKDLTKEAEEEIEKNTEERTKEAEEKIKIKQPEKPRFTSVDDILEHAISMGAVKVHIDCVPSETKVFYHINKFHAVATIPESQGKKIISEIKYRAHIEDGHIHKHGDFSISKDDKYYRLLVTSFPLPVGEKLNIEIEELIEDRFTLSYLGMRQEQINLLDKALIKNGVIFVVGPSGSGKTATMYALLKMLSQKGRKSATLENPIECYLEGVDQFEVKPLEGLTFFNGFKKLLSQNYDAIMIEGIRDSQTLNAVFEASERGKIIIAPLLDKNIFTVFTHLEEMGIRPETISRNLRAIVNQRLVLRLCSACKAKVIHDQEFGETFKNQLGNLLKDKNHSNIKLREFRAGKCKNCEMTGFSGHTGLFEVILVNKDSEKLLRNRKAETKEDNILKNSGVITLYQDGLLKVSEGITTQDEINRVIE